jgi:nitrogen fixation/metabolism regulation signal transduction histidine kinase
LKKISFFTDALANRDSSFFFTEKNNDAFSCYFNSRLNVINKLISNERKEIAQKEKFYELIMKNVNTGIITVDQSGIIVNCNDKALSLLSLGVLTHISQIKRVDESLYKYISGKQNLDGGNVVTIYSEAGKKELSIRKTSLIVQNKLLNFYSIDDISSELDENEQESWIKLIRVLTHEIMNTVTPISSLSDTLLSMNCDNKMREGLTAISSTTKGLISFVDSYRKVSIIPSPIFKPVYIKKLLDQVVFLEKENMYKLGLECKINISDELIMIYVDENQIMQVLINVIKNALFAIQMVNNPILMITVGIDSLTEDVIVEIMNNGEQIPRENQDHIFIPFFTTKEKGTGIGLSLSRQIMLKNNGNLRLKSSNDRETIFVLTFR